MRPLALPPAFTLIPSIRILLERSRWPFTLNGPAGEAGLSVAPDTPGANFASRRKSRQMIGDLPLHWPRAPSAAGGEGGCPGGGGGVFAGGAGCPGPNFGEPQKIAPVERQIADHLSADHEALLGCFGLDQGHHSLHPQILLDLRQGQPRSEE